MSTISDSSRVAGAVNLTSSSDTDSDSSYGEAHWSFGMNSSNSFNYPLKGNEKLLLNKHLDNDLRIGSAYHIGSRARPIVPDDPTRTSLTSSTSGAFPRQPFTLIHARELGDVGPASKYRRLRYKASRWRVDGAQRYDGLQCYGNRSKSCFHSDAQTFKEMVQGSLWSVSRMHLESKIKSHRGCVNTLSFNYRGDLIASGSDDHKVVVTKWATKQQMVKYHTGHTMNIFHVKFLPESNDTRLVSCACDSEVRLAQLASDGSLSCPTRLLVAHDAPCHKLALPSNEPYIVLSAGADGQVYSIDTRTTTAESILSLPFAEFFSITCNPVNPMEVALCGRSESIIRIYDRRKMSSHDPKSGYMHYFGADHLRSSQNPATNARATLQRPPTPFASIQDDDDDLSASGRRTSEQSTLNESLSAQLGRRVRVVLTGLRDRTEFALGLDDRRQSQPTPSSHPCLSPASSKYSVTAAVYTNQGDAIMASYNDEDIYLFDIRRPGSSYIHKYCGHRNMQTIVSASFFGPNSEYVVSGSDDGFFYIWDRESEGIVQWLHADLDGAVNVIESHPFLPVLATAGLDFDFKIWSPLRPLSFEDDEQTANHWKYTFSRVPPDIRRLRRSRLAKTLFHPEEEDSDRNLRTPLLSDDMEDSPARPVESEPTTAYTDSQALPITSPSDSTNLVPTHTADMDSSSTTPATPSIRKRRRRSSPQSNNSTSKANPNHSGSIRAEDQTVTSNHNCQSGCKQRKCEPKSLDTTAECQSITAEDTKLPIAPPPPITVAPHLLPFDIQDLKLRTAQNWINRERERLRIDDLDSADSRILSALDSVAQLFVTRRGSTSNGGDESHTTDDEESSGDGHSGITGSFVFLRRPRCPVERSEETFATRDRNSVSSSTSLSSPGSDRSCPFAVTMSSPTSSDSSSSSSSTFSDSSTLSSSLMVTPSFDSPHDTSSESDTNETPNSHCDVTK